MRTGAAAGTTGHFHQAALHSSEDELLEIVVPFLEGGIAAGEPTIVAVSERTAEVVRSAFVGDVPVRFMPGDGKYTNPLAAIRAFQALFGELVAEGASQIRVVGEVPVASTPASWWGWLRYEEAVNTAYDPYPVWALCSYDRRTLPPHVLAHVLHAHPHVAVPGRTGTHNELRLDRSTMLERLGPPPPDPLQERGADIVLLNPSPVHARRAAADAGLRARLDPYLIDDLVLVASELVTNAHHHGTPPVTLELWSGDERVVLVVTDAGPGPADPFAGLVRNPRPAGGHGLWIVHQVCTDVVVHRTDGGCVVRAVLGPAATT